MPKKSEVPSSKFFGTGLPRTGTASLAMAFLQFGLRTAHCCFDQRLYDFGDAFVDTPVYADYPALDGRYPGSRFVHTTRDPQSWYGSVESSLGHFVSDMAKPQPASPRLETDRRCWLEVFGSLSLDRDEYLRRREVHEAAVRAYFRDRPRQLLIINVEDGDRLWEPLAQFLGRPVPSVPFPHANRGTAIDWWTLRHPLKLRSEWADV